MLAFYKSVGEAVLWHSDDRLAVEDWGICDEITFHQIALGSVLRPLGYQVERSDQLYHIYSRQAFIWPYDEQARLMGENLYEDKTSLRIEEVDRSEAITAARVREIHRELLHKLEVERGSNFWLLNRHKAQGPRQRGKFNSVSGLARGLSPAVQQVGNVHMKQLVNLPLIQRRLKVQIQSESGAVGTVHSTQWKYNARTNTGNLVDRCNMIIASAI